MSTTTSSSGPPAGFFGSQNQNTPSSKSSKPDFAAARKKQFYRPGATKYDDLLPPNYVELVPKAALEAFRSESEKFDWKNIPEWVPPKELR
ncbi:hypothetical protein K466DRAFT_475338 [Polyporus arcularius HHB13444]|uniref:Uncharacterized protein n=1 Tax=Polyporus arcularius HHB13444 TaxID=1314778 RepID=A0A5C3PZ52_9APHY|nr:hypothetical protein K466DRAFT_475338 [Polyporus arcularius HHB13444]